jgi:hypothetical protein
LPSLPPQIFSRQAKDASLQLGRALLLLEGFGQEVGDDLELAGNLTADATPFQVL